MQILGDEDDRDSAASADDNSENEQDELGDDRDELDLDRDVDPEDDGEGEVENDEENEDNDDEEDEQDQDGSQYSSAYLHTRDHAKAAAIKSENAPANAGDRLSSVPSSQPIPSVSLIAPSPTQAPPSAADFGFDPTFDALKIRTEMMTAGVYDIVPTIAAPHSTSINAICAMPDLRWVFSGGSDGYIRKFDWHATANGKVMLTVAQRHPFVDSVTKAGVLVSYWENEDSQSEMQVRS